MAETFEVPYERFGKVRNKVPQATLYLTESIGGIACVKRSTIRRCLES